jgi:hypothetical protein
LNRIVLILSLSTLGLTGRVYVCRLRDCGPVIGLFVHTSFERFRRVRGWWVDAAAIRLHRAQAGGRSGSAQVAALRRLRRCLLMLENRSLETISDLKR